MRSICFRLATGLALLASAAAHAQVTYQIQPIVRLGDKAGNVSLLPDGYFDIGTLNDNGQIIFTAADTEDSEVLIQYSNGTLTPIVARGNNAAAGSWPDNVRIAPAVHMNNLGNAAFSAGVFAGDQPAFSTYFWDSQARQVTLVTPRGAAVGRDLVLEGSGRFSVINNSNEIALEAKVVNAAGQSAIGIFFRRRDGQLVPVALPGQALPDGRVVAEVCCPHLNDAGAVAFLARRLGDEANVFSSYLWEGGQITRLVEAGASAPGGRIGSIRSVWLNNGNRNVLMEANLDSQAGPLGLYLLTNGQLNPVAVPNQAMPGGGQLRAELGPSYANEAGQHAFLAELDNGQTAAYLMEPDGRLSLVLKSGMMTNLAQVANIGQGAGGSFGIGLNNKGQIVVTATLAGAETLALLTPASP